MYKALEPQPLVWASEHDRDAAAARLRNTFIELAVQSRNTRWSRFAQRRKFHLLSIKYHDDVDTGQEPAALRDFLDTRIYWHHVPRRAVFLGLELRSSLWERNTSGPPGSDRDTVLGLVRKAADRAALDNPESLDAYKSDIAHIESILFRQKFRDPTAQEMNVIQSWFCDVPGDGINTVVDYQHFMEVENPAGDNLFWEFTAVTGWRDHLPEEPWYALANSVDEHAWVISARGELERGSATRIRAKAQRRKLDETRRQTEESGDYERVEDEYLAGDIADVEEYYAMNPDEPSVAGFSLLAGRRVFRDEADPKRWAGENQQTYADVLREHYAVQTVRLPYLQLAAAREMCPCAPVKIGARRPFRHHLSLGMVTHSGLTAMATLGDEKGAHIGYALPDETEVRFDFGAASAQNQPPMMLVAGQPGSGKTVVSQALLHQASLAGVNSIFVNPKGADSLKPLLGITGGEHVVIGADSTPGTLDPFRFCDSQDAAVNIAMGFLDVLIPDMDASTLAHIEEGLRTAENPGCFMEAAGSVKSAQHRDMLEQLRRSNPVVGLCMGTTAGEFRLGGKTASELERGVLLVEFAGDVQLPAAPQKIADMSRSERYAVAAVGLMMQATSQLIVRSRRGQADAGRGSFLIIDEAWIMLSSKYLAAAYLESLARLGRSLDVTVILATQRVSDIVNAGLTEYLSRALLLKLTSEDEQKAALRLLGLDEDNREFRELLAESGSQRYTDPRSGETRRVPPVAWMRDLQGRVGVVRCEFPDDVLDVYSTNPEDRRQLLRQIAQHSPQTER